MSSEIERININETKMPELQKCAGCKCKMLLSYFDIIENTGQLKKTCRKCLERNKINHEIVKYGTSVIYKIFCKDESITECYVGSTTDLNRRKSQHKSSCTNKNSIDYNRPVYRYIRDNGGFDNWIFEVLENYPCRNKEQLVFRERYWFEKLSATLNSCYPQRNREEWEEQNKEHLKEYRKEWYLENKEERKEYGKKWRGNNKEKIKDINREYNSRPEVKERLKQKVQCECGCVVSRKYLSTHRKSKKHQNLLKSLKK